MVSIPSGPYSVLANMRQLEEAVMEESEPEVSEPQYEPSKK